MPNPTLSRLARQLGLPGIAPARGVLPADMFGIGDIGGHPVRIINPADNGSRSAGGKWLRDKAMAAMVEQGTLADELAALKGKTPATIDDLQSYLKELRAAEQADDGQRMVVNALTRKHTKVNDLIKPEGLGALTYNPDTDSIATALHVRGPDSTGVESAGFLDYLGATPHASRGEATRLYNATVQDSDLLLPRDVSEMFLTPLHDPSVKSGRPDSFYKKTFPTSEYISPLEAMSDPGIFEILRNLGELHNATQLGVTRIERPRFGKGGTVTAGALASLAAAMAPDDAEAGWLPKTVKLPNRNVVLEHMDPADLRALRDEMNLPKVTGPITSEGKRLAEIATRKAATYGPLHNSDTNLVTARDAVTKALLGAMRFTGKDNHTIEEFGTYPSRSGVGDSMMEYLLGNTGGKLRLTTVQENVPYYTRHGFGDVGSEPWSDSIRKMEAR